MSKPCRLRRVVSKKNAGADPGPDGAVAGGGAGGAGVEAAPGDGAGGLPRASEQGGEEVARQDMAGQTPRRQIPAAVELGTVIQLDGEEGGQEE